MRPRLTLLVTSPRLPAGILTRDAWTALDEAAQVLAADLDDPTPAALVTNGVTVQQVSESRGALAARLVSACAEGSVVWIGSPDADPGLTDALAEELTSSPEPPEVEMLVGSWDPPGARLLDVAAVMDTLRSPGGCPWDAEQTHESLTPYLVEESAEAVEAVESGDREHLVEELGDVLLQVFFHARIATEHEQEPFDIDDVAHGLVSKLIRRHPHVFGDGEASSPEDVERAWEQIKRQEKPGRDAEDLLAGIPRGLPLPYVIAKVRSRVARRGGDEALDQALAVHAERAIANSDQAWSDLRREIDDWRA
ncbi:MazG family protein [Demetria terragena]|uniref:MazG family protein n=1 Tax=Demetria terragena TaxID=63959 RepID=UPI00036F8CE6|nr:MazG family protein [Demetria terragena]